MTTFLRCCPAVKAAVCGSSDVVHIILCSRQPNGCDCGVFTAAFMFQWALVGGDTRLDIKFDVPAMHNHLAQFSNCSLQ